MAFLSIIRRWHKREHVPIREISRRTGADSDEGARLFRDHVAQSSDMIAPTLGRTADRCFVAMNGATVNPSEFFGNGYDAGSRR